MSDPVKDEFIKSIRQYFQSPVSRQNLMVLMMEEIRVQKMQDQERMVTQGEALEQLQEEFQIIVDAVQEREARAGMSMMMDMMGLEK